MVASSGATVRNALSRFNAVSIGSDLLMCYTVNFRLGLLRKNSPRPVLEGAQLQLHR